MTAVRVAPTREEELGQRFGPYTTFQSLGRGGMAELFIARAETELGATRHAVVKLILPAFAGDARFAEMFVHEAKLAARLNHRHIVQVIDLGREGDRLYIAMEYVEGLDLAGLVRRCSEDGVGMPAAHALGIMVDVLDALDYAHRRRTDEGEPLGIVHRDVSPSNILISCDGEVKLCDFGIARANDLVADKSDALKGKAGYMSPEHARGEELDARADVFAAGIVLWELLSGRKLYRPRTSVPLLAQARRAEVPPLPDRGLPHPEELDRIIGRALARDREERYPTALAFQKDLEEYLARSRLLASRLELGDWLTSTFGTAIADERRASERRLPKSSIPPPRSSAHVRSAERSAPDPVVPPAPRVPLDLAPQPTDNEPTVKSSTPPPATEAELLSWARRRGLVTFVFFCSIAATIATVWALTR